MTQEEEITGLFTPPPEINEEITMIINGLTLLLVLGAAWIVYEMFKVWQEIEELYSDDD